MNNELLTEPEVPLPADVDGGVAEVADDGRAARRAKRRELFASAATLVSFGLVFVVYAFWLGTDFLNVHDLLFDVSRSTPQLLLAVGLVICLSCHVFDLSVGALATLTLFLTIGLHIESGLPLWLTMAIAVAAGAAAGLVNGLLVTKVRLNAFIATLGTAGVYGGLTTVYASGRVIAPTPQSGPLPSWYSGPDSIGAFQQKVPAVLAAGLVAALLGAAVLSVSQRFPAPPERRTVSRVVGAIAIVGGTALAWALGIIRETNWMVLLLGLAGMVVWILLKYTTTGRSMYAIGGNVRAAGFAGIRTDRVIILAFVLSGTMAAIAGILLGAVQGSASPGIGESLLLPAYAAVFLSTVFVSRGRFHVWGAVFGGIALIFVASGLVVGGVPFTWTQVINGAVLVAAVSLNSLVRR